MGLVRPSLAFGEGRWTAIAAIEEGVPAPALLTALPSRFSCRRDEANGDLPSTVTGTSTCRQHRQRHLTTAALLTTLRTIVAMRPTWAALTLTVLIAEMAGCADPDTSAPSGPTGSSSPSAAASTALPLQFSRTGGLIGVDEQASISTDGAITDAAGTPRRLNEDTFAQLKQLLADVPATGPSPTPSSASVCSDGYRYRLRTPLWSAVTDDCSLQSQPALAPLVRLLTPLLPYPATPPSSTASPR